VAALLRLPVLTHPTGQVTNYRWSTDVERLVNGSVCLVNGMVLGHAKDGVGWAWSKQHAGETRGAYGD
jgi:hypothetical protein